MTIRRDPNKYLLDFLARKWEEDHGLESIIDVFGTRMTREETIEEMRKGTHRGVDYYNHLFSSGALEQYADEWKAYRKAHGLL